MTARIVVFARYIALAALVIAIALIIARWRFRTRVPEQHGLLRMMNELWHRWREHRIDMQETMRSLSVLRGKTCLIVEPDNKGARVLGWRLGSLGCRTIRSRSGAKALARANKDKPDFIIADSLLPDISAMDFYNSLETPIPVIFLGVLDNQWNELRSLGTRVGLLAKPYDPNDAAALAGQLLARQTEERC